MPIFNSYIDHYQRVRGNMTMAAIADDTERSWRASVRKARKSVLAGYMGKVDPSKWGMVEIWNFAINI